MPLPEAEGAGAGAGYIPVPDLETPREDGFYWAMYQDQWEIVEYVDGYFYRTADELWYLDNSFNNVDERRITREDLPSIN